MAKTNKKTRSAGRTIKLPGADKMGTGGGGARIAEGDYRATVAKIEQTETKEDHRSMLCVHYKISEGKKKGTVLKEYIVLVGNDEKKDTLWKLRQLLEAMGKTVPSKPFNLNIDKLIGGEIAITVEDGDPYKGRIKSEVRDVNDVSILDEEDDEEEDDEDSDDDDDEEDDDLEDVDLDDEL